MKYTDIPVLPDTNVSGRHRARLRNNAPRLLRSIIEDTRALPFVDSLDDIAPDQIKALSGGNDAATYLILHKKGGIIVKLGLQGLAAEVEALAAWAEKAVHAPAVIAHGIVPSTRGTKSPVSYIVEEALVDVHGRLAETCWQFLRHSPEKARRIGYLMGKELTKAHRCISDRSFGDFADSKGNTAAYGSWNSYLLGYFATQEDYLLKLQIDESCIQKIRDFIANCTFVKQGRYLHGDFSARNTAIQPYKERIYLFDPNPVIGDPSWDIAILCNNAVFSKRHSNHDTDYAVTYRHNHQLLLGFRQGYARRINEDNVVAAQLIQAIMHTKAHETKVVSGRSNQAAYAARRETVLQLVEQICQGAKSDPA